MEDPSKDVKTRHLDRNTFILSESSQGDEGDVKVIEIVGTLESFGFSFISTEDKIELIKRLFDVRIIREEVEKDIWWVAGLIEARMDGKEVCPKCSGIDSDECETCFGTGEKRI